MTRGARAGDGGTEVGNPQGEAAEDQEDADEGEAGGDEGLEFEAEGEGQFLSGDGDGEHHGNGAEAEDEHVGGTGERAVGDDGPGGGGIDEAAREDPVQRTEQQQRGKCALAEERAEAALHPAHGGQRGQSE